MKKKMNYLILLLMIILMVGCTNAENLTSTNVESATQEVTTVDKEPEETVTEVIEETEGEETVVNEPAVVEKPTQPNNELFGYKRIEVDGCDLSGHREPNVVVDVGYGDREYWAFTNMAN
jgi:flagellar hook assembly protein FlgD